MPQMDMSKRFGGQTKPDPDFDSKLKGLSGFASLFAAGNPKVAAALAAFQFVGGVVDQFRGRKEHDALGNVLDRRKRFHDMLDRQARGDFTDSEREVIWDANEPLLDHVYGGVAARGLAESGAGQEEITRAQMEPFIQAQQHAQSRLEESFGQSFAMIREMMNTRPSVGRAFGGLFQSYLTLQQYTGESKNAVLDGLTQKLESLDERIAKLRELETSIRGKIPTAGGQ